MEKTNMQLPLGKWAEFQHLKRKGWHPEKTELSEEDLKRFWTKTKPNKITGCIEWIKCSVGRPAFRVCGKKIISYRVAMYIAGIQIPEGKFALHKCDNGKCVNYKHIYIGWYGENNKDTASRGNHPLQINPLNSPNRKLSKRNAVRIAKMIKNGTSISDLAKKYKLSMSAVYSIKSGRTWSWISKKKNKPNELPMLQ